MLHGERGCAGFDQAAPQGPHAQRVQAEVGCEWKANWNGGEESTGKHHHIRGNLAGGQEEGHVLGTP